MYLKKNGLKKGLLGKSCGLLYRKVLVVLGVVGKVVDMILLFVGKVVFNMNVLVKNMAGDIEVVWCVFVVGQVVVAVGREVEV